MSKENIETTLNNVDAWVSLTKATEWGVRIMYTVTYDKIQFQVIPTEWRLKQLLKASYCNKHTTQIDTVFKQAYKKLKQQKTLTSANLTALTNEVETQLRLEGYHTILDSY